MKKQLVINGFDTEETEDGFIWCEQNGDSFTQEKTEGCQTLEQFAALMKRAGHDVEEV